MVNDNFNMYCLWSSQVMERDAKFSDLDERATQLQEGAMVFEKQATSLKRKQWWRNLKMQIILGVVIAVIILIIILSTFRSS